MMDELITRIEKEQENCRARITDRKEAMFAARKAGQSLTANKHYEMLQRDREGYMALQWVINQIREINE